MVSWNIFPCFALTAIALWLSGAVCSAFDAGRHPRQAVLAQCLTVAGIVVYSAFIVGLWHSLGRPPMRTMGETRLWYSLFMMLSGWMVYRQWRYRWILGISLMVASVFILINIFRPEIHDHSLMPALQSLWFVPHVTVYMFSYSIFGCAALMAVAGLWQGSGKYLPSADRLVGIGLLFLTLGMLSGCIWAKQAWGSFWNWDPKETWAAATWCAALVYIHLRLKRDSSPRASCIWLILTFALLQMCWYGVNLLPAAQGSMHTYFEQ